MEQAGEGAAETGQQPAPGPTVSSPASSLVPAASLLFVSGCCALVYQIGWLRDLRLVFGASTAASSAVLAIFVGGLGIGGVVIGRRADRHPNPLRLYADLETLIAVSAGLTPALIWLVRLAYVGAGGTHALGLTFGTILRLLLSALVLGVPTCLMGGTLPAVARAVTTNDDRGRKAVALLYGVNTLGAVIGSFAATFFLLELFGTRKTLWIAALLNLLVAIAARQLARSSATPTATPSSSAVGVAPAADARFVFAAAWLVGFVFFLMELVWYRMLAPLLGGTVFAFGLILSMALLGIGLGGAAYSLLRRNGRATLWGFAHTCLLEALSLAIPLALGDRIAILASMLRPFGEVLPFWGDVAAWTIVCAIVILPAALVAGYQFPMLIALLGEGRAHIGRQLGVTYAWNTTGAIAGSLAGGFGLLPLLSAPGAWRAATLGLVALGLTASALAARRAQVMRLGSIGALAVGVFLMLAAPGPTAVWRHSGIGAGRGHPPLGPTALRDWGQFQRQVIQWEADGIESSVAVAASGPSLAFIVNGKIDGNARSDAGTALSGLLGALLSPDASRALVIGLGTGETAGWLGAVPGMARVDTVELEPKVLDVARDCASMNQDVLHNPKVHISIGDAREALLVSPDTYDLVFSEPSNPYRAGIASLFTREYYEAVSRRLSDDGIFIQWVQAYEVDAHTLQTFYATLGSVFPEVETWQGATNDLLLLASKHKLAYDVSRLRARLEQEPFRTGAYAAWQAKDLEGVFAHFVAAPGLARAIGARSHSVNTDDRNIVEFGFGRTVGRAWHRYAVDLLQGASLAGQDRPAVTDGSVDWDKVADARVEFYPKAEMAPLLHARFPPARRALAAALDRAMTGDKAGALSAWRSVGREPANPRELILVSEGLADAGDDGALPYIARLRTLEPFEGDSVLALLRTRQNNVDEAVAVLERTFAGFHQDPWVSEPLMTQALDLARVIGERNPAAARRLLRAIEKPFAMHAVDQPRLDALASLVEHDLPGSCQATLRQFGSNFPWARMWLSLRLRCYSATGDPRASEAAADLREFIKHEPEELLAGISGKQPAAEPRSSPRE